MSILTDYYRFERIATKSKTRLDCVASTGSYPEFEEKRATKAYRATDVFDNLEVANGIILGGGVEVFVARGKSKDRVPLYNLLTDGEFEEEMNELRQRARAAN